MKTLAFFFLLMASFAFTTAGQVPTSGDSATSEKPKKAPIFRATKDQIKEVQTKLKADGTYSGEATGKLDPTTRASIKTFQSGNGLKQTGTLNRATLEKMKIELTESQKAIPVSESSFASADSTKTASKAEKTTGSSTTAGTKKPAPFRANKGQIVDAQKLLRSKNMYSGEETGKLDDATRAGLKEFQGANGLRVTGTLNAATLEKMGIVLTEAQKANVAAASAYEASKKN